MRNSITVGRAAMVRPATAIEEPNQENHAVYDEGYERYKATYTVLAPCFPLFHAGG